MNFIVYVVCSLFIVYTITNMVLDLQAIKGRYKINYINKVKKQEETGRTNILGFRMSIH